MIADIITIGDEILIGQIVDTNSAWLGKELSKIGINIHQIISISDNRNAIIETVNASIQQADIIFITGGLGPTNDDITKHTLCKMFDGELILNNDALKNIANFLKLRNYPMNENNHNQALLPSTAQYIPNYNGTASGMWFERNGKIVISMPGVPYEMTRMMSESIIPKLKKQFQLPYILHKTIIVNNIAESVLAEMLADWELNLPQNIKLAYLPAPGFVKLRLSTQGDNNDLLNQQVNQQIQLLRNIIPNNILSETEEPIDAIVAQLLKENNLTLATAESCTGGGIAHTITSRAGSSAYFKGSVVSYCDEIKEKILSVPEYEIQQHTAVSQNVVKYMAENVRKMFNTDFGISTSGIAGPTGGTDEIPVGTIWMAVASAKGTTCKCYKFGNDRHDNMQRAINAVLSMLATTIKDLLKKEIK